MKSFVPFLIISLIIITSPKLSAVTLVTYQGASSHAGYGHLSTSETEAMATFNFDCSERAQRLRSRVCGNVTSSNPGEMAISNLDQIISNFSADRIRQAYLEHLTLQLSAFGARPPADISLDCMRGTPEYADYSQLRGGATPSFSGRASDKHNVVAEQIRDEALLSAFVMDEYYRRAWSSRYCNAGGAGSTECVALSNSFLRLSASYPSLYQHPATNDAPEIPPVRREVVNRELRPIVETAIGEEVLGMSSENHSHTAQSGALSIHQTLTGSDVYGPSQLMNRIIDRYRNGDQRRLLALSLTNIRVSYSSDLLNQLRSVCPVTGNPISTAEMLALDPAAIRQAMLDANTSDIRTAMEYDLCTTPMFRVMRNIGCGRRCDKVTGQCETVVPAEMDRVRNSETVSGRVMVDYPFGSQSSYNISRTPPLRRNNAIIRTTIQVTPPAGKTVSKVTKILARWQACVQTWFTEQARANGYSGLSFQFQFITNNQALPSGSPPPVQVNLQTCYHSTCNDPALRTTCCPNNAVSCTMGGHQHAMQADSGNILESADCNVLRHEIGHMLGASDEYREDYYPFNALGEADSLMNGPPSASIARLYPRHFETDLLPW